jgi:hypothetical protein
MQVLQVGVDVDGNITSACPMLNAFKVVYFVHTFKTHSFSRLPFNDVIKQPASISLAASSRTVTPQSTPAKCIGTCVRALQTRSLSTDNLNMITNLVELPMSLLLEPRHYLTLASLSSDRV